VRRALRSPGFALAAAACVMLGGLLTLRSLRAPEHSAPAIIATGLTRQDGRALEPIAPRAQAAEVSLSDGSELWVDKGGVLAPLDVSPRSVVLHLMRGRSKFSVKPGGPRRWVVEAGLASIEVVGTRFSVDRRADGVLVTVEEGKVLVRSAALADGVARLTAGQSLHVPARSGGEQAPVGIADEASNDAIAALADEAVVAQRVEAQAQAEPSKSPAGIKPAPRPEPRALDADALFAIADDARMTRDYRGAIVALERVIREHAADPRARLAAFTVGRIRDEHLYDLPGATAAYEQALSLGLSGSLAEDCYSRLLRVLDLQAIKGQLPRQRVEQAAQQYLQRYPKGRYAAQVRGVLDSSSTR